MRKRIRAPNKKKFFSCKRTVWLGLDERKLKELHQDQNPRRGSSSFIVLWTPEGLGTIRRKYATPRYATPVGTLWPSACFLVRFARRYDTPRTLYFSSEFILIRAFFFSYSVFISEEFASHGFSTWVLVTDGPLDQTFQSYYNSYDTGYRLDVGSHHRRATRSNLV